MTPLLPSPLRTAILTMFMCWSFGILFSANITPQSNQPPSSLQNPLSFFCADLYRSSHNIDLYTEIHCGGCTVSNAFVRSAVVMLGSTVCLNIFWQSHKHRAVLLEPNTALRACLNYAGIELGNYRETRKLGN